MHAEDIVELAKAINAQQIATGDALRARVEREEPISRNVLAHYVMVMSMNVIEMGEMAEQMESAGGDPDMTRFLAKYPEFPGEVNQCIAQILKRHQPQVDRLLRIARGELSESELLILEPAETPAEASENWPPGE